MKPVVRFCKLLITISCALAFAQPTPQQIHQHQMAEERALQRDQEQRDEQIRQAQIDKMREIDRQQAEEARQQVEKARAQAIATQENFYVQQQEEQAKAQAKAKAEAANQDVARPVTQSRHSVPVTSQTQVRPGQPAAAAHWSFRNMTTLDKAGLAALGVLLVVLAYAAGIIPAKRIWGFRNPR
jgi:fused signal recognition particle receptor